MKAKRLILIGLVMMIQIMIQACTTVQYIPSDETPKIDINTATHAELMTLPSIGKIKSQRIIENRPFESVNELRRLNGFGKKTIANIKDRVTVKGARDD